MKNHVRRTVITVNGTDGTMTVVKNGNAKWMQEKSIIVFEPMETPILNAMVCGIKVI